MPSRSDWNEFAAELLATSAELGVVVPVLVELMTMRRALESEAAASVAVAGSHEATREIRVRLDDMANYRDLEPSVVLRLDVGFHHSIVRATGNQLMTGFVHRIRPMVVLAREISHELDPDAISNGFEEHHAIVEAIESGDSDRAFREMARHLSPLPKVEPLELRGVSFLGLWGPPRIGQSLRPIGRK